MNIRMETYSTNNNPSVVSDYDVFSQSIMVRGSEVVKTEQTVTAKRPCCYSSDEAKLILTGD